MKTYFIDQIEGNQVSFKAESISELEIIAIRYAEKHGGHIARIYVHCSHVISKQIDEQNIEYIVSVNNRKRTIKRA